MAYNVDFVRIKNIGDKDFYATFDSKPYGAKAGETFTAPFEAAIVWLGDPNLLDNPDRARFDRTEELQRIQARYGAYKGHQEYDRMWYNRPQLEVWTLDDDERIFMVADDPDGKHVSPASTTQEEKEALQAEVARMRKAQAEMLKRLDDMTNISPSLDDVALDKPTKVGVAE